MNLRLMETRRRALRLSHRAIAERMGVERPSVSRWFSGQTVPELDRIIPLADLLGVSADALLREERSESGRVA